MKKIYTLAFLIFSLASTGITFANTTYTIKNNSGLTFIYLNPPFTGSASILNGNTGMPSAVTPLASGKLVGQTKTAVTRKGQLPVYCPYSVPSTGIGTSFSVTNLQKGQCRNSSF